MQALRLARTVARPALAGSRGIAVTANASATASTTPRAASIIPLSNVEAQWENLSSEDQLAVHQQLAELQKKDWRTLSIDEKKAGEYMTLLSVRLPVYTFFAPYLCTYTCNTILHSML